MTQKEWIEAERRAIANNPDLPEDVAAAFAEELNEMADASGVPKFSKMLGVPDGEGHLSAEPDSIQELFPHLRDPRYV